MRLFYEDSHKKTFSARVLSCTAGEGGYLVTLSKTAFYPEGGGQACDIGTLNGVQVVDVQEREGEILHLCQSPLSVGEEVTGEIDWARRFDLMQQHTGEHILSGIIHARYGYQNSGFHVGTELLTVDFDGPIPQEDLWELERAANEAIWKNIPVHCYYPSEEELPNVIYRTKRALPWPVRIVQVGDVDSCACCGVHVKHTGEVGFIKLISCIKFHQGVRIEMVCGVRAYEYMSRIFHQNRQISHLLSAKMPDTAVAVEQVMESVTREKYRANALQARLFSAIAQGYRHILCPLHFETDLNGGALRELAETISKVCHSAIVCSGSDEEGYNVCIIAEDAKGIGTRAAKALNGRGGGKDFAFQGRFAATKAEIEDYFGQ